MRPELPIHALSSASRATRNTWPAPVPGFGAVEPSVSKPVSCEKFQGHNGGMHLRRGGGEVQLHQRARIARTQGRIQGDVHRIQVAPERLHEGGQDFRRNGLQCEVGQARRTLQDGGDVGQRQRTLQLHRQQKRNCPQGRWWNRRSTETRMKPSARPLEFRVCPRDEKRAVVTHDDGDVVGAGSLLRRGPPLKNAGDRGLTGTVGALAWSE